MESERQEIGEEISNLVEDMHIESARWLLKIAEQLGKDDRQVEVVVQPRKPRKVKDK